MGFTKLKSGPIGYNKKIMLQFGQSWKIIVYTNWLPIFLKSYIALLDLFGWDNLFISLIITGIDRYILQQTSTLIALLNMRQRSSASRPSPLPDNRTAGAAQLSIWKRNVSVWRHEG